ncbi:MAG: adenylate/guanylate cyclase domain-containing protein [Candidatus Promineifilaceae bacterium]
MNSEMERDEYVAQVWRSYMTGAPPPEGFSLPWYERSFLRPLARVLPSDPRCQICYYPFEGLGGALVRTLMHLERSTMNPHLCNVCERFAESFPGGVEIEVSLLFVDIRDSTPLAESMDATSYSRLIDRFYQVATNAVYRYGGLVEKLVGDEVVSFFPPAFAKDGNHARAAVDAARDILSETGHGSSEGPWVPVGAGVHTGQAFVGAVGEPGKNLNITVLGDNVNVGSRLAGQARTGEIVISLPALQAADLQPQAMEQRTLKLKGKEAPVTAWVETVGS